MLDMETSTALTASEPVPAEQYGINRSVAHSQAGEAIALDRLVADHQQRIARLVHRLLDGPDDVEDVVQEVFLAAFKNLGRFRGQSKVSTWLTTIALNKCRSYRRWRLLRLRTLLRLAEATAAPTEEAPPVETAEIHEEVRRAVRRLSSRYREPIVLRYFEQLSVAEIAEALEISANNVEVRLSRARRKLGEILSNRVDRDE